MVLCTKRPTLLALPLIAVAALWMHRARRVGDGTAVSPITIDTSATYTLVGVASGKCVDVPNGSTSTGVQLDIATCVSAPRQQFKLDAQGSGYYHLRNVGSGLCMDVNAASTADGAAVIQWDVRDRLEPAVAVHGLQRRGDGHGAP